MRNALVLSLALLPAMGIAAGDAKPGAQLFGQCAACHSTAPGEHLTGPSLARVWMHKAASAEGFLRYSDALKFATASFDSALVTWALCSIPDAEAALREIRRVLKRGGELFFIEHGLARDPGVAAWQRRLTPLWRPLAGGCHSRWNASTSRDRASSPTSMRAAPGVDLPQVPPR